MRVSVKSLFCKKQNLKETIKQWILSVEKEQNVPKNIVALNFGLFEPYGVELTGAKHYDPDNDDWACEEDYVPKHRVCPAFDIPVSSDWEEVLNRMTTVLNELIQELPDLRLWQVEHITMGFSDGDLVKIK